MFGACILRNSFFRGMDASNLSIFLKKFSMIHLKSGEFVYNKGQPADGGSLGLGCSVHHNERKSGVHGE